MHIGCDLFSSSIKFQVIQNSVLRKLKKEFNDVKIIKILPEKIEQKKLNKIEIYWGNRVNSELIKRMPNLKWIHYGSTGFNQEIYKQIIKKKYKSYE